MGSDPEARPLDDILTKRERQVMDVVHRRGEVTAADVYDELPDAPSYNAVRSVLRLLEEKGRLVHRREGRRYVYRPTVSAVRAARTALDRIVRTFFEGSTAEMVNTLIDADDLSAEELDRLQRLIDRAREREESDG